MLSKSTQQLVPRRAQISIKPTWHPPWKLMRVCNSHLYIACTRVVLILQVISGHLGWVRCVAIDPSNEWFVTGSGDRTIKVGLHSCGCI